MAAAGKQYAGKTVMIGQTETGEWILKIGEFIPVSDAGFMILRYRRI
jgi:hypothetical protein